MGIKTNCIISENLLAHCEAKLKNTREDSHWNLHYSSEKEALKQSGLEDIERVSLHLTPFPHEETHHILGQPRGFSSLF